MTAFPAVRSLVAAEAAAKNQAKGLTIANSKLKPPAHGQIPVAVAISEGVTVIDFAGPWEVFRDTMVGEQMPFQLFTIAEKIETITGSAGLKLVEATAGCRSC